MEPQQPPLTQAIRPLREETVKRPTDKPLLLDTYCKAGGCTAGYQRAGFYVVGVDIQKQSNYCGDEFH